MAAIREATGVWFTGGRQWRLVDSYAETRTEEELWALLERGGVIGGSSAGATIQGSYLARGDTATNTIMMGSHEEGFGFVRNTAIDQHLLYRNRQFDMLEIIEARPELLGIGIDENTAIVVQGDRFEVIGESYVVIYDNQSMLDSGGLFYFLAPGDQYDMAERQAYRPARTPAPWDASNAAHGRPADPAADPPRRSRHRGGSHAQGADPPRAHRGRGGRLLPPLRPGARLPPDAARRVRDHEPRVGDRLLPLRRRGDGRVLRGRPARGPFLGPPG